MAEQTPHNAPTGVATVLLALALILIPAAPADAAQATETWARLADCESGEWDRHRRPIPGSARWDHVHKHYQGGVHFDRRTWDAYAPPHFADDAHLAHIFEQVWVAEAVLNAQGWKAWPVCSRKIGMRR